MVSAFVALALAVPAFAQTVAHAPVHTSQRPLTLTDAVYATYRMVKGWILTSADIMPEGAYAWQPTPEVRTFGRLIAHVADDNATFCGAVIGKPAWFGAIELAHGTGSKRDLQKALADSFATCDRAFAIGERQLTTGTAIGVGGLQPKLGVLAFNNAHIMEHYGNIATYLRLKGLVPPSSDEQI
jgi:hypothetical protein